RWCGATPPSPPGATPSTPAPSSKRASPSPRTTCSAACAPTTARGGGARSPSLGRADSGVQRVQQRVGVAERRVLVVSTGGAGREGPPAFGRLGERVAYR